MPRTTGASRRGTLGDWGKLVLRLSIGGLLLFHGIFKLRTGIDWMVEPLAAVGLPAIVRYGAYVGEVVAPILSILGKFTRIAGAVMALQMVAAIVLVRRDQMFAIDARGGGLAIELELLFLLGGIAIALLGSGRYAVSRGEGRWD